VSNNFYREFEDKHRGKTEDIRQRLTVYLPLIRALDLFYPESFVIDVGCGRGEWLKLLRDNDIQAIGVDLNDGMLAEARKNGLTVELEDCIEFLKKQADDSLTAVTGFHIVEHLPFDLVHTLVIEAHRALKPGGLLILETPNPENISVGSCSFYMDPTHQNPLPPDLLKFLPDYYGFHRTRVVRLQESPNVKDEAGKITLTDVLKGVSPDYSIVAQKKGPQDLFSVFNEFYVKKIGVTLDELADRYDYALVEKIENIEHLNAENFESLQDQLNSLLKIYEKIEGINNDLIRHNQNLEDRLSLVYKSNSWRLTSPLRRSTDLIKRANLTRKKGVKYLIKALLRKLFNRLLVLSGKYPNAKGTALNVMRKVGVYDLVRKLYSKSMFLSDGNLPEHFFSKPITHYNNMSNRAKKIFEDLHDAEVESDKGIK
jgi:SAM-dependent methyltransferase